MAESNSRMVFVLGSKLAGNRQAVVVESGAEYDLNYSTVKAYTDQTARFPYEF